LDAGLDVGLAAWTAIRESVSVSWRKYTCRPLTDPVTAFGRFALTDLRGNPEQSQRRPRFVSLSARIVARVKRTAPQFEVVCDIGGVPHRGDLAPT
jgi:hypothetical protein